MISEWYFEIIYEFLVSIPITQFVIVTVGVTDKSDASCMHDVILARRLIEPQIVDTGVVVYFTPILISIELSTEWTNHSWLPLRG